MEEKELEPVTELNQEVVSEEPTPVTPIEPVSVEEPVQVINEFSTEPNSEFISEAIPPVETPTIEPNIDNTQPEEKKNNKKWLIPLLVIIVLVLTGIGIILMFINKDGKEDPKKEPDKVSKKTRVEEKIETYTSNYRLTGNELEDFDLHLLQYDNNEKNIIYSPLSIKYGLKMLSEGADGNSKGQLDAILGDYQPKKYKNSKNLALANSFFIKDTIKEDVREDYINLLKNKYNAEVQFDTFKKPDNVNKWVKKKTLNLIPTIVKDINSYDFLLINALALNMEWNKELQPVHEGYYVSLKHEEIRFEGINYVSSVVGVGSLDVSGYRDVAFNGDLKNKVKAVSIAAVANKYDVVNTVGADTIRAEVTNKYSEWLQTEDGKYCSTKQSKKYPSDVNTYVEQYMKDISSNYKYVGSSTDFSFYDDEEVRLFAKDFKEYDGNMLEYISIMPKKEQLKTFITNTNASKINEYINKLKPITLDVFEDGYLNVLEGKIPVFKYDYEINLKDDLKKLGVVNIFDEEKANLSNMIDVQSYIDLVLHKANIEFSNKGVKAAAATVIGGVEATSAADERNCLFDYKYPIPVKTIDISFDKPFLYIIRDKNTKETWFAGTVYQPTKYDEKDNK